MCSLFERQQQYVPLATLLCAALVGCGGAATGGDVRYADAEVGGSQPARKPERQLLELGRLDREALVRAVVARNPDVETARQSYRAARARQPQAEALPDPMLLYELAPLSIGSSNVDYGHTIRLSQRFPWPGKLSGREESASATAAAAREGIEVTKLDLALEASELFDDYWLIERSLDVNAAHQTHLREIEKAARAQYEVGRGSLQDPLQAEVELTHLERQELSLKAGRDAAIARMNALLHRAPDATLPPPPENIQVSEELPASSDRLQREALAQRGELRAEKAKVRAAEASIGVADREYYPDITVMGTYTTMFRAIEHQFMLGVEFPLPIQRGTRAGAVDEASAEAAAARSRVSREVDAIRREVDVARLKVVEAIQIVQLYRKRLIPVAKSQLDAASSGYSTGANGFVALIDAEKNLMNVELAYHAAIAELSKRRARLERTLGEMPGLGGGRQ